MFDALNAQVTALNAQVASLTDQHNALTSTYNSAEQQHHSTHQELQRQISAGGKGEFKLIDPKSMRPDKLTGTDKTPWRKYWSF